MKFLLFLFKVSPVAPFYGKVRVGMVPYIGWTKGTKNTFPSSSHPLRRRRRWRLYTNSTASSFLRLSQGQRETRGLTIKAGKNTLLDFFWHIFMSRRLREKNKGISNSRHWCRIPGWTRSEEEIYTKEVSIVPHMGKRREWPPQILSLFPLLSPTVQFRQR